MTEPTSFQELRAEEANSIGAAIVAGVELAGPQPIGTSTRFHTQVVPAGAHVERYDLHDLEEARAAHPNRKRGTVHVQDAASFIAYIGKHQLPETEVYADLSRMRLVGVINAHQESAGEAGHGDHRVNLELLPTDSWVAWTKHDKEKLEQIAFAEHLEDNAADVIRPDAATMLEIAQSVQATTSADFKQAERIDSGTVAFRYEETVTARAGQTGDLEIPTSFTLSLAPFEGAEKQEVTARFRYRISNGRLHLSYALLDPAGVARKAFLDHVDAVRAAITPPVFQGRPE